MARFYIFVSVLVASLCLGKVHLSLQKYDPQEVLLWGVGLGFGLALLVIGLYMARPRKVEVVV